MIPEREGPPIGEEFDENGNFRSGSSIEQEPVDAKEAAIEDMRARVEGTRDIDSIEIEAGIRETVVGLNLHEINTSQSCEGHIDQGGHGSVPWVDMRPQNEPSDQFEEGFDLSSEETTRLIISEAGEQFGVSEQELRSGERFDAILAITRQHETPQYQAWRKEAEQAQDRVAGLLEEFYVDRDTPENDRIIVRDSVKEKDYGAGFRIATQSNDYDIDGEQRKEMDAVQIDELRKRQAGHQQEMAAFGEFLVQRFREQ